jgi:ABC-2 type transport system ATP-binding protein
MSDYNFSIEAKNLNKTFNKKKKGGIKALIDFNINIPKGSIYGLLGPNGAGKSTFINILGSLVKKDSGKIKICGIDIDEDAKESRKKIGIVPQELNIDPFFTPIELLELQAGLYGVRKKDRKSEEILSKVGLLEQKNAYARTLSGGMRRRLLVAKALVHNPEVIILDEPTAGVDITIINKGKILKSDTKENILNLIGKKTVSFVLYEKIQIPHDLNRYNPVIDNNKLLVNYDKNITQLKEIIEILNKNNVSFYEINTYESDLEDVFINLIKNHVT